MIYDNNKARMNARISIMEMHAKLANVPGNVLSLGDVQTLHHLLDMMDAELRREIRDNK